MTKYIFYLGIMLSSSAGAQTGLPVDVTPQEALYPYADGWVSQQENDEFISFYLHPPTLKEFREK